MQFGEDRCTQVQVIVVTDPQTHTYPHTHTNRQDRLQYTALQLSCSVMSNAQYIIKPANLGRYFFVFFQRLEKIFSQ